MPLITPEDIGTTPRSCLSPRRRLQAWERTNGKCVVCGERIDGARERWIIEHIRALELGGADEIANMGPAHEACGREKTRDDHTRTAQAKRQKLRHIGAAAPERPLPGSRTSPLKRKLNGTVVPREAALSGTTVRSAKRVPRFGRSLWKTAAEAEKPLAERIANPQEGAPAQLAAALTDERRPARNQSPIRFGMSNASKREDHQVLAGSLGALIPLEIASLLTPPSPLPDEEPDAYGRLLTAVGVSVEPRDTIEWLWVKDVVDLLWEAQRLRRLRTAMLRTARRRGLSDLLDAYREPAGDTFGYDRSELVHGWSSGEPEAVREVAALLAKHGLTDEAISAQALSSKLDDLDRIERMIANADGRRNGVLREIERRRSALGSRLRAASDQIIDGEAVEAANDQRGPARR
ncbi:HNH endonuclease [Methylobacterium oxalidis]|uniref:HNH nuclease domain-containing protein n=1 Tax=Methylobacterium oxalidis TaxID=944322 RepID=A0A512JCP2_9HYPH|nr:HNH endonuclease [Methylobacterium oxalidis]GEP07718.1 hypothetical protein MOX02_57560 [Methylobacterium oxalidis]GJE35121.1 hypothetical protein LDDCCGHA_5339 [Methylobacterium oxalidis]GLS66497.1 hypothetical protein GCM10007888_48800 [Methylobacterium oxalidis]